MSWRLMVGFALPWAFMAILGSISTLSPSPAAGTSAAGFDSFVNTTINPDIISIDEPGLQEGSGWWDSTVDFFKNAVGGINDVFQTAKQGFGWLNHMVNAATLNYDFLLTGWLATLRYLMLAMAAPLAYMAAREMAGMAGGFISGITRTVR